MGSNKTKLMALVLCLLIKSMAVCALAADEDPEEKMMWKGTLSMESVELHQFEIFKSGQSGTRSHFRNHETRNNATVYISAADILQSGDVQAQGTRRARIDNRDLRKNTSKSGRWGRSLETFKGGGTATIEGSHVRITIIKKAAIDSADAIQDAIGKCGTDPDCLARALEKFKGLLDDSDSSFPIKIVATILTPVQGQWVNHIISTSYEKATGTKTTEDGPTPIDTIVGGPMMVEMDGTYTRGKKGDTITAYLSKTETLPYKAWDKKNHPRETRLQCSLRITNGPPEVRIYVDTAGGGQKDITDKETKVMVGQRLHLTAHVASTGLGEEIVSAWHIPGRPFSDWIVLSDDDNPHKKADVELTEEFEDSSIHFAWSEGSYGGWEKKVRYTVDYAGKNLTGETTFLVFSPGTSVDVKYGTFVGYTNDRDCDVAPGPHGVVVKSQAMMPSNELDNGPFTIQYVQLVKSNSWGIQSVRRYGYFWVQDVHGWMLDTVYPYNTAQVGQGSLSHEMQDTPGGSLGYYDTVYMDQEFEVYLMFKPPAHPELDTVPLFVSLYKVDWAWRGAARAIDLDWSPDKGPCFEKNRHRWICRKPPSKYPHAAVPWPIHPKWDDVARKGDKMHSWKDGDPPNSPSDPLPQAATWSCDD